MLNDAHDVRERKKEQHVFKANVNWTVTDSR